MFRSITIRLTAFNVLVISLILVASAVATYFSVRHILRSNLAEELALTAQDVTLTDQFTRAFGGSSSLSPLPPSRREGDEEEEAHEERRVVLGRIMHSVFMVDASGRVREVLPGAGQELDSESGVPDAQGLAEALAGGRAERSVTVEGQHYRVLSLPVFRKDRVVGAVQVAGSEEPQRRLLSTLLASLLGVGGGGAALALAGGYALTTRALVPVRAAFERQRNFIADASHELRTPVAVVRADAEVLARSLRGLDPEDAQILQDLVHESTFLAHMIDQLIAAARMEGKGAPLKAEPMDLAALVRDAARAIAPLAAEKDISLQVDIQPEAIPMAGDMAQVRLALMGLLDNAVKYNRAGGTVRIVARGEGPWATVSITDTGPGLSEQDQKRVFERFYRGDGARASGVHGSGLGLAIARQVARQHGGDVTLQSRLGEGTTATLRLRAS